MSDAFLILGLGNPGNQYLFTRHNVGFMVVDKLAMREDWSFKTDTKLKAMVASGRLAGQKVILAKPTTYMNLSGEAMRKLMDYYDLDLDRVLVLFDDIDLPMGRIRVRTSGSAGSHNGMKSIIQHMGTQEIPRLRIGIGSPDPKWDLADYVLSNLNEEEKTVFPKILDQCIEAVTVCLTQGYAEAMNRFNHLDILNPPPS